MIQLLQKDDFHFIQQIVEISDLQLGAGFQNKQELYEYLNHPHCKIHIWLEENQVVGYNINISLNKKELIHHLPSFHDEILSLFPNSRNINWHKTIAVHPDYTGKKIGSKLFAHGLKKPPAKSLMWLSIAWASGEKAHLAPIMKKHNFVEAFKAEAFWKEESIVQNYHCIKCGAPPCNCNAYIFYKL